MRQFYYLQDVDGECGATDPDNLVITVTFTASDDRDDAYGSQTIEITGVNEAQTFTGVASAVEFIDLDTPNFAKTDTIAYDYARSYATDEIVNFDNTDDRIDLSQILEGYGRSLSDVTISYDSLSGHSTVTVGGLSGVSGGTFNVATVAGQAGDDHHALAAGDTIEIVFDSAGNSAQVTIV